MTGPTAKIPKTAIEQVRRAMKDAPACEAKAVTKIQAVQALAGDIRRMQSKGYEWEAIVQMLSEHGIAVNVVSLKSYLQRVQRSGAGKTRRKPKGAVAPLASTPGRRRKDTGEGAATLRPTERPDEKKPSTEGAAAPRAELSADASKASKTPLPGNSPRRSMFVPEEDTDL